MRSPALAAALAALIVPAGALAQDEPTYDMRIRSALDLVGSNREGAMRGFREAVAADPSRPDAYCYVAEVYRLNADFTSALDNFQTCLNIARTAHSTSFAARGAHGVASTFERMGADHFADARNAWTAYERLTEDPLVFPEIARERQAVIDAVVSSGERAAVVRGRIADRVAVAAAAASASGSGSH